MEFGVGVAIRGTLPYISDSVFLENSTASASAPGWEWYGGTVHLNPGSAPPPTGAFFAVRRSTFKGNSGVGVGVMSCPATPLRFEVTDNELSDQDSKAIQVLGPCTTLVRRNTLRKTEGIEVATQGATAIVEENRILAGRYAIGIRVDGCSPTIRSNLFAGTDVSLPSFPGLGVSGGCPVAC
jgi:hypothetical protein